MSRHKKKLQRICGITLFFIVAVAFLLIKELDLQDKLNHVSEDNEKVVDLDKINYDSIDLIVNNALIKSKVPGVAITIVNQEQTKYLYYGYQNQEKKEKVTESTLFELGSMSKAYTALGILKLQEEGKLSLEDSIYDYIPWLHFTYKNNQKIEMRLGDLLYHMSGIPFRTIGELPEGNGDDSLEITVKKLDGIELDFSPGSDYQYATVNYDLLGYIIQLVSGMSYEDYIEENILMPLGLEDTYLYRESDVVLSRIAQGYKLQFMEPVAYDAPIYRGNTPAGYIISGITDMNRWMRIQLGLVETGDFYSSLVSMSHKPNITVLAEDEYYYGAGWEISMNNQYIRHGGSNPNYSSMIIFKPDAGFGICVLANLNSNAPQYIAENVMNYIFNEPVKDFKQDTYLVLDLLFSIITILAVIFSMTYTILLGKSIYEWIKKKRKHIGKDEVNLTNVVLVVLILLFGGFCIYYLPNVLLARLSWNAVGVWGSPFIKIGSILSYITVVIFMIYITFVFTYPKYQEKNYAILVPLSLINGISSAMMIFVINETFNRNLEYSKELFVYFLFVVIMFVYTIKLLQGRIIIITNQLTFEKRRKLVDQVIHATYQKIESIGQERIYTGLNNDANAVSELPDVVINIISNTLTLVFCLGYLYFKNIHAFIASTAIILVSGIISFITSQIANRFWERNRSIQDTYFKQMNDLVYGFKELVLNHSRRKEFFQTMNENAALSANFSQKASMKLLNFNLYNVLMYNMVFGVVVFLFPIFVKNISINDLRENLFIVFYMIGPFGGLTNAIGRLAQLKVNMKRIDKLLQELKEDYREERCLQGKDLGKEPLSITFTDVEYSYRLKKGDDEEFRLGPINAEFHTGEITFIVGGNGSGKSTLAKLITGLYTRQEGEIYVNNERVTARELNEIFSAIYSDFHLFSKLYGIDYNKEKERFDFYLKLLKIEDKVNLDENGVFESLGLSSGQKKRLAFAISCLEDKQMILLDEWAAEQDISFRNFFYYHLLPMLKKAGKGVIVISHDNHYFNVADQIIELERGIQIWKEQNGEERC